MSRTAHADDKPRHPGTAGASREAGSFGGTLPGKPENAQLEVEDCEEDA